MARCSSGTARTTGFGGFRQTSRHESIPLRGALPPPQFLAHRLRVRHRSAVQLLELPPSTPAGFLAWEDALLDTVEEGGENTLWFWESQKHFVVVGYGQQVAREVNAEVCAELGIPVLRRSSGGGAVLQGPGCLNYGVALRVQRDGPLATIPGANREILTRVATALAPMLPGEIRIEGHTDLTAPSSDGLRRKFSGNAQRRKRESLLFHGTFLLNLDLDLIPQTLRTPSVAPDYRAGRDHRSFLQNLRLDPHRVRGALREAWEAHSDVPTLPVERQQRALAERYSLEDWNRRR